MTALEKILTTDQRKRNTENITMPNFSNLFDEKFDDLYCIFVSCLNSNDFNSLTFDNSNYSVIGEYAQNFADELGYPDGSTSILIKTLFTFSISLFLKHTPPSDRGVYHPRSSEFRSKIEYFFTHIHQTLDKVVLLEEAYRKSGLPTVGAEIEITDKTLFYKQNFHVYDPYEALMQGIVIGTRSDSGNIENISFPVYSPTAINIWIRSIEIITQAFLEQKHEGYNSSDYEHPLHINFGIQTSEKEGFSPNNIFLLELGGYCYSSEKRIVSNSFSTASKGPIAIHQNNHEVSENRLREKQNSRIEFRMLHSTPNFDYEHIVSRLQVLSYMIELEERGASSNTEDKLLSEWKKARHRLHSEIFPKVLEQEGLASTEKNAHLIHLSTTSEYSDSDIFYYQISKINDLLKVNTTSDKILESKKRIKVAIREFLDTLYASITDVLFD